MREILVFFAAMIISPPGSPDPRAWRSSNPRFRVYRMPQTPPHSWMQVLQRFEVYLLVLRLQAHHQRQPRCLGAYAQKRENLAHGVLRQVQRCRPSRSSMAWQILVGAQPTASAEP